MAVTVQETHKAAYHLGFTSSLIGGGLAFGMPTLVQMIFPCTTACTHLLPEDEPKFRQILDTLDMIESKQAEAVLNDYLVASEASDVKLRADYPQLLRKEYRVWRHKLASILGCEVAPWADAGSSINATRSAC
jgi:hypothetical protein